MRSILKSFVLASVAATGVASASPAMALDQLERSVQTILREFRLNADVERLSNHQLTNIRLIAHGPRSEGERRLAIKQELRRGPDGCGLIDRAFGCGRK